MNNTISSFQYTDSIYNEKKINNFTQFNVDQNISVIEDFGLFNTLFENIIIGNNVESVGKNAFAQSDKLKKIFFNNEIIKIIQRGTFHRCKNLQFCQLPKKIEIIEESAFRECISLKNIILPKTIKFIKNNAFTRCFALENIDLPNIETIDDSVFDSCISLQKIKIQEGTKYIKPFAFHMCKKMHSLYLPSTIQNIDKTSFVGCKNLQKIYCKSLIKNIEQFFITSPNAKIINI